MGVKSTQRLTRDQAESRYVELRRDTMERELRAEAVRLTDTQLEDKLEELSDQRFNDRIGGSQGGFDNFLIISRWDEE